MISLAALVFSGLNLGIDFEGGTQWQFTVAGKAASTDDVRSVLEDAGQANTKVLILGQLGRPRADRGAHGAEARRDHATRSREYAGIDASDISVTNVGPTLG